MQTAEQLSRLIGDIYDAALNPALWHDVLARFAQFVDGMSAALYAKDAARRSGDVYYDDGGISPEYKQRYFETYVRLDPVTTGHYFADIEEPVSTVDFIAYDEFVETRFYKEWVRPQGIVDFVSVALDKSATAAAMFGVFRNEQQGLVDDEMRRRMRLIVPHIRRAVLIGRVIDLKTAEAATFGDTFDGLSAGMFLVTSPGRRSVRSRRRSVRAQGRAGDAIAGRGHWQALQAHAERAARAARHRPGRRRA